MRLIAAEAADAGERDAEAALDEAHVLRVVVGAADVDRDREGRGGPAGRGRRAPPPGARRPSAVSGGWRPSGRIHDQRRPAGAAVAHADERAEDVVVGALDVGLGAALGAHVASLACPALPRRLHGGDLLVRKELAVREIGRPLQRRRALAVPDPLQVGGAPRRPRHLPPFRRRELTGGRFRPRRQGEGRCAEPCRHHESRYRREPPLAGSHRCLLRSVPRIGSTLGTRDGERRLLVPQAPAGTWASQRRGLSTSILRIVASGTP